MAEIQKRAADGRSRRVYIHSLWTEILTVWVLTAYLELSISFKDWRNIHPVMF